MPGLLPAWLHCAADGIRRLAERPWTLFLVLLAMNAVGRPASITAHDARLYTLQALNQAEHGAYADDVFLRYGSQDQYTLFSHVLAPMVRAIGLRPTFFAFYLVFNTLLILGMFRLVRALIDDVLISTLALVFLVTAPLCYGGHEIFSVHEQFFTTRTIGTTFTLFALERIWRQRYATALVLLLAGLVMHPLMAFGGVMIWTGCVACARLPMRGVLTLAAAGAIVAAIVLGIPAIGTRVFGTLEDECHNMVRVAVPYNYPDAWTLKDWLNFALSFAVPIAACATVYRSDPARRRFYAIVLAAGAVGFLATLVASWSPYALLFQGQPYRVMWILKVLQVALGFVLIASWSQSASVILRGAALGLIAFFCITVYIGLELGIFAIVVPLSIMVSRVAEQSLWYGAARGFVLAALAWMIHRGAFFLMQRNLISQFFDLNEWVLCDLVSPMFWLVGLCIVARIWQTPNYALLRCGAVAASLLAPIAMYATEVSPAFLHDHTRLGADMAFLRDFVREHEVDGRRPCVYCPYNRADLIYIDVKATSYFSILQTAGVIFNTKTAVEIDRRARVVAKFEMARQREEAVFGDNAKERVMENLYKVSFQCPEPTIEDLVRLCEEPGLDYVAIPHEFPGLYSAKSTATLMGSVSESRFRVHQLFVYECYKVRASVARSGLDSLRGR